MAIDRQKKVPVSVDLDLQNLILSDPQVGELLGCLDDAHLRIALLHHPPFTPWFTDFDVIMQTVELPSFDFILRVHDHWEQFIQLDPHLPGNNKQVFHVASGALYTHKTYPNNFNAVQIDLDAGKGRNYWWRYDSLYRTWVKHTSRASNGYITFALPGDMRR